MNKKNFLSIAESFIFGFKQSIDDICEKYGNDALIDFLADAGKGYDVVPRAELEAITESLARLKEHVDSLFEDCLSISAQLKTSGEAPPQVAGEPISLIEMLKALDSQFIPPERHELSSRR